VEDIGIKQIRKIVKTTWASRGDKNNPLKGLRIASHPGCHYNRPSEILQWDNPLNPQYQEKLIKAIGGIPVEYDEKTLCCGSCVSRTRNDIGLEMIRTKYQSVLEAGAQLISVNCPACFQMLESHQRDVNKKFDENYAIPIFYITELIAMAFGYTPEEIGLKFHTVRKGPVFS
jgi:heterodisulfide reductase subunit B